VKLIGTDGNAFSVMSLCRRAWIKAGKTTEEWKNIQNEMTSGDYDNVLQTAMNHFEVS